MKQIICKSMKKTMVSTNRLLSCIAILSVTIGMGMLASCSNADNPSSGQENTVVAPSQLKQGVWTEYDDALLTSGKYTEEQLANMPAVGMMVEGDKGYFFTYTAEGADNLVEGKISYDNKTGKGTIAFPNIKDSPISGQTVSFSMTSDETMQFEFTYEGAKTTGTCAWLCENLDNWNVEIDDAEWNELMAYYDLIAEDAGPDASIDWSGSEVVTVEDVDDEGNMVEKEVTVTDLDEPLEWNDETVATRAGTRAIGIGTVVSKSLNVFSSLFKEDPNEKINAKLDAVLGKVDEVLANQQLMMMKLDEINGRLIAIAQKMERKEIVEIFNKRNEQFYNKLKVQNRKYFDSAYNLYKENKNAPKLGDYAKAWVGKNEEFANLTWEYMEYLTTVEHTDYGKGLDRIYDGLVFGKYPWEHMGIGDRQNYRAYDLTMIAKCLFMISLYSTYGGLNDIEKEGLYNNYKDYKPQLKKFCEFTIANPDEFRVCQIKGAHFVMHKEIQAYNYIGSNNECPNPRYYGRNAIYMPMWHEAGSIKIENPEEMKSKLITTHKMAAVCDYYNPNWQKGEMSWSKMLVEGEDKAGGAVCARSLTDPSAFLVLYTPGGHNGSVIEDNIKGEPVLGIYSGMKNERATSDWIPIGFVSGNKWTRVPPRSQFYAVIVEKHY